MTYPIVFGNLAAGNQPASDFDTMFNIMGQQGNIPCTASGTNAITLSSNANYYVPAAYTDGQLASFKAINTSTSSVTAQLGGLALVNVYTVTGTQASTGDIVSGTNYVVQYWTNLNSGSGGFQIVNAQTTSSVGAQQLASSALGFDMPINLRINATVAASALTVAIKTAANADASSSSPILIPFRNATIATGNPVILSQQAALSFTAASTSTLGTPSSNVAFRLWVIAYYNGGTLALGLFNASTFTVLTSAQIFPLPEQSLVTTASGTSGGNSAGTHYANVSSITNTPFRILGFLEWASGLATAGTWASGPTTIQLFGPGIKKPGDEVQRISFTTTSNATTTAGPTVTNLTASISLTSPANLIDIKAAGPLSTNTVNTVNTCQVYRGAAAQAVSNVGKTTMASGASTITQLSVTASMVGMDKPNTVSSTAYSVYINSGGGATATFPDSLASFITLTELMS